MCQGGLVPKGASCSLKRKGMGGGWGGGLEGEEEGGLLSGYKGNKQINEKIKGMKGLMFKISELQPHQV